MLKEYIRRFSICISGLILYGFGNFLGVKAGSAGTNAWNTLALGLSGQTSLSFGTAMLVISGIIIVVDLIGKGKLGFGTILVMILQASIFQLACRITHYEPRSIVHEDILDTIKRICKKG